MARSNGGIIGKANVTSAGGGVGGAENAGGGTNGGDEALANDDFYILCVAK